MLIERETLIAKQFIKNDFLNQSLETFGDKVDKADYKKAMKMINDNMMWYTPRKVVNKYHDNIGIFFEAIGNCVYKNNLVDKEEVFAFVRDYYYVIKKQNISDSQIGKMKVADLLDLIIIWLKHVKDKYLLRKNGKS